MNKNVPNIITITRIALLPFIYFFWLAEFIPHGKAIAIGVFIIAAATDFVDGFLARKYNLVSNLGKLLDPMADKLLSCTGLILIAVSGVLPMWAACTVMFIILGRDFSIDCLRMVAAKRNIVIAANWSGKLRTIVAMIAMPYLLFMSYNADYSLITDTAKTVFDTVGYCLIGLAVVLCAYSWFYYFYDNRGVFKNEEK
jgi:CDP-diacylglycerol--glycerol-3-phosphate 3-phosphatidyltransferase